MQSNPIQFFTISACDGQWPNREYFEVLPGTVLFHEGTREQYIDWLYDAAGTDEDVAMEIRRIVEAAQAGRPIRIVVKERFNDFRGAVITELVQQIMEA